MNEMMESFFLKCKTLVSRLSVSQTNTQLFLTVTTIFMFNLAGCNQSNPLDTAFGPGNLSASPTPQITGVIGNSALSLSPINHNFGMVSVGQSATALTMVIENVTSVPIYLSSLTGSADADFSITGFNCPSGSTAIAAGGTCSAQVNFTPLIGGNLQYQVTALFGTTPGDTSLTTSITLTGVGVAQVVFAGLNVIDPSLVTTTSIPLSWNSATGASSYTLYQSTDGGSTYTISQVLSSASTSWTVTGLTPGTAYTFKAKAFNALGQADTNTVTQTATTDVLGSFSALTSLNTSEGSTVTSGDIGLNCTDPKAHYPTFMSISSQSDPTAQCVLLTSPYRIQCTPGFHVGSATWSSTLNISCLLDGYGTAYTQNLTVNVAFTDRAPVIAAIGNQSVLAGMAISTVTPSASDPNLFTLNFSCKYDTLVDGAVSAGAANCSALLNQDGSSASFNTATGVFNWIPPLSASGVSYELKITAADSYTMSASSIFVINVGEPPPDPAHSIITLASSSVSSGGTTVVTLHAKDSNGNVIPKGGSTVTFSASTGAGVSTGTFSATTDNGDGTYSATFTGVVSGTFTTIHANAQGVAITSALPTITVNPGPISVANSYITLSSGSVASNTSITATLTSKDAAGNFITLGGKTVLFGRTGGTSTGTFAATTDNGNGTYSASFTGVVSGTATSITASINGVSVTSTLPTVIVTPGALSLLQSILVVSGGATILQSGSSVNLTVTTRDSNGNALTSGGQVVVLSNSGGSSTGNFSSVIDNGNGTYTASFTGVHAGSSTNLLGTIGGLSLTSVSPAISVIPGTPSVSQSLLGVGAATLTSGNTTSLTLTTKDANGNVLTSGGSTVAFSKSVSSTGTISSTTDNGDGTYTATFTGVLVGTTSIGATIGGSTVTSGSSSITVTPGSISLSQSLVSSSSPSAVSGLSVTLTLQAKDAAGNNLITGGRAVLFNRSGGTSQGTFSSVTDNGNGTYTATFTGTTSGTSTSISATVDGLSLASTPALVSVIPANLSLANSTVSVSSATLAAGSTIIVTLTSKDTTGNTLTSGGLSILFSHTGGTSSGTFSSVTDRGDGTYSAIFSGTISGSSTTITATIGGSAVSSSLPQVTVNPGTLSLSQSTLVTTSSTIASGSTATLTAYAKDANGNLLGVGGQTVVFTKTGGTSTGTFSSVTDNGDGTYSTVFTGVVAGTAITMGATIGGNPISSSLPTLMVTTGPISYSTSLVTVSNSAILSGQTSTLVLTVKDANGNTASGGGLSVTFAKSGGTSSGTFSSVTDNGNGTYSAIFTGTTAGTATSIISTISGNSVTSSSPTITVSPGALSLSQSPITLSSGTVISGSTVSITLTTKDVGGNTLVNGGQTVVFSHTGGISNGTISSTTDNGNGTYTAIFTATNSGSATSITATIGGNAVTSISPTITVSPGAISLAQSVISVSSSTVTSGNTVALTFTARDANGNTLTTGGSAILFSRTGGTSNGTISSTTDNGNGTYTATFTATISGTATSITATVGGSAVTSASPTITVSTGAISIAQSLVSVSSSSVVSGGVVTFTLTAKDLNGNNLSTGGSTVVYSLSGGSSGGTISATTDNANGTYTATFSAVSAGTASTVNASIGGSLVASTLPTITVIPGTISLLQSSVSMVGNPTFIASGSAVTLKLTTKDSNGNQLTSGGRVVVFTATGGTATGAFSAVTDNLDGTYSATFTGASAGTANNMSATIGGVALTGTPPTLSVVPGTYSLSSSVVTVSSASITSGNTSTITLTAKDAHSNLLTTGGLTVTFSTLGGSSTGTFSSVTDNLNGTYSAIFTGVTSGTATSIVGNIGGVSLISSAPAVTVNAGALSVSSSTIAVSSSTVTSGSSITLTFTAKDLNGNMLTSGGKTVVFGTIGGTSAGTISGTTDNINGTYTASFMGVTSGSATTITATANGATITGSAPTVTVNVGAVSLSQSTFTLGSASIISGGTSTLTLVLKDLNSNIITDSSQVSNLSFSVLTSGTSSGTIGAITSVFGSNGTYVATLTGTTAGTVNTIRANLSGTGNFSTNPSFTVTAGAMNVTSSTVSASSSSVLADGSTTSTITVTLKDASSNLISGKVVSLASNRGATDTIAPATATSVLGVATFTVKSSTKGASTLTATNTTDTLVITQTAGVTFISGLPSATISTVSASPSTNVIANNVSNSTFTIVLNDANGNTVSGKTVTLTSGRSGSDTVTPASVTSDSNGQATFSVTSSTTGTSVFTATDTTDSIILSTTPSVSFIAGPASQIAVSSGNNQSGTRGAILGTALAVLVKDANNNVVNNATINWAVVTGAGTLTSATSNTNASGIATITYTMGTALLTQTVSATIPGTSTAVTFTATAPDISLSLTSFNGAQLVQGGSSQTITWSASDPNLGATPIKIQYSSNNGSSWTTISAATSNAGTYAWSAPSINSNQVLLQITATDSYGNTKIATSTAVFTVDSTAPTLTALTLNGGLTSASGVISAQISGSDNLTGIVALSFSGNTINPGNWVAYSGSAVNIYLPRVNGTSTIYVWAQDGAGNVSSAPASGTVTISASPPTVYVVNPVGGTTYTTGNTVHIDWSASSSAGLASSNPISIGYTTVNATSTTVMDSNTTFLSTSLSNGSNSGCTVGTGATGCYEFALPLALNGSSFAIVVKATDINGYTSSVLSSLQNSSGFKLFAGKNVRLLDQDFANMSQAVLNANDANIVVDSKKNIYFPISSNQIMKINNVTGKASIYVGDGSANTSGDGQPPSSAVQISPGGGGSNELTNRLAVGPNDELYWNDSNGIRRVNPTTGYVETYVGGGAVTKPATGALRTSFLLSGRIGSMTFDSSGQLIFGYSGTGFFTIIRVKSDNTLEVLANTAYASDGGSAIATGVDARTTPIGNTGASRSINTMTVKKGSPDILYFIADDTSIYSLNLGTYSLDYIAITNAQGAYLPIAYDPLRQKIISSVQGSNSARLYSTTINSNSYSTITVANMTSTNNSTTTGLTVDNLGNIYTTQLSGLSINLLNITGGISTLVGGSAAGGDSGQALLAQLSSPRHTVKLSDNSYAVVDTGNYKTRLISTSAIISSGMSAGITSHTGGNFGWLFSSGISNIFPLLGQLFSYGVYDAVSGGGCVYSCAGSGTRLSSTADGNFASSVYMGPESSSTADGYVGLAYDSARNSNFIAFNYPYCAVDEIDSSGKVYRRVNTGGAACAAPSGTVSTSSFASGVYSVNSNQWQAYNGILYTYQSSTIVSMPISGSVGTEVNVNASSFLVDGLNGVIYYTVGTGLYKKTLGTGTVGTLIKSMPYTVYLESKAADANSVILAAGNQLFEYTDATNIP